MRTFKPVTAGVGAILCTILTLSIFTKPAFGDDWGATLWRSDTDLTVAVAESTNLNDGFDWYAEAEISWSDEYLYGVGLQAGYTCPECDDHTDSDVEESDAYVSGEQPLFPGMTYYGTATTYTCDTNQDGDAGDGINPSECTDDIDAYISFTAGVPSITAIAPSSDAPGNAGQESAAAEGLADLHDEGSIPLIVNASARSSKDCASTIAKPLVYFDSSDAQRAVDLYVPKEAATIAREHRTKGYGPFN